MIIVSYCAIPFPTSHGHRTPSAAVAYLFLSSMGDFARSRIEREGWVFQHMRRGYTKVRQQNYLHDDSVKR